MVTDEVLGRAVKQAQWRHHRTVDGRLGEIGTTIAQWDALRAIDRAPGASAHELAEITFQSDQAFGALAGRLLGQGLIERTPGRGRRIEHRLTESGCRMLSDGLAIAEDFLAESFAGLDGRERRQLLELLERIGGPPTLPPSRTRRGSGQMGLAGGGAGAAVDGQGRTGDVAGVCAGQE